MAPAQPTQPRHNDIIIRRRFGEHASTHAVKQIYAVTYPGIPTRVENTRIMAKPRRWRSGWRRTKGVRCGKRRPLRVEGERS